VSHRGLLLRLPIVTTRDLALRSDAELLHDRAAPDDSFAVFYRRHVNAVLRFTAARGLSAGVAADVVADTFVAALRGRHRYRPEREDARLWLLAIAARRIVDVHRRDASDRRKIDRLRSDAIVLTQADRSSYEELSVGAHTVGLDALADLPLAQQQAIRARIIEDRSYAEIAAVMGLSQAAARQSVSRGLAALRRTLKETR
jgi:RNA polymerase sigma factor (sigma-70 family)